MKNCEMKVNGNILTITIDVSKEFGKSYFGASSRVIIASTEGYIPLPEKNDIKMGLMFTKKHKFDLHIGTRLPGPQYISPFLLIDQWQ